ncbi:MAG: hypothetical protein M3546_10475 [Actinomycetota bacterium]|nr:hypothetical protein [Actinomycetota bacterium]
MDATLDRRQLRGPEPLGCPLPLVLGHGQKDRPHHLPGCARPEVLGGRVHPAPRRLDPVQGDGRVLDGPAEAREVPNGDPAHVPTDDGLDRPVPPRPRRVAAGGVQLLHDVEDLQALAPGEGLNLLALELRRDEAVALAAADLRHPHEARLAA